MKSTNTTEACLQFDNEIVSSAFLNDLDSSNLEEDSIFCSQHKWRDRQQTTSTTSSVVQDLTANK